MNSLRLPNIAINWHKNVGLYFPVYFIIVSSPQIHNDHAPPLQRERQTKPINKEVTTSVALLVYTKFGATCRGSLGCALVRVSNKVPDSGVKGQMPPSVETDSQ